MLTFLISLPIIAFLAIGWFVGTSIAAVMLTICLGLFVALNGTGYGMDGWYLLVLAIIWAPRLVIAAVLAMADWRERHPAAR